ncbi:MAG: hypothetical protein KUG82_03755 [Pseudomonadales bacterium]|nr:hypothetical protein [Pseudomonadales bacterium]
MATCKIILLKCIDDAWPEHQHEIAEAKASIHLFRLGGKQPIDEFKKIVIRLFDNIDTVIDKHVLAKFKTLELKNGVLDKVDNNLKAPYSTWTYLINDQLMKEGLLDSMISSNGFSVALALFGEPLMLAYLVLKKCLDRK